MRYVYLGDRLTDIVLAYQECEPVRREDGKCIVSTRMATQLVVFAGEDLPRCVLRGRPRVQKEKT